MRSKYKKVLVVFILMFNFLVATNSAFADDTYSQAQIDALDGLVTSAKDGLGEGGASNIPFVGSSPAQIIGQVVGIALSFIGVLFFGLFIYAGFKWMTARGNEEEVKKSIDLIQAAVFGLIIILAAYAFTAFLTNSLVER